MKILLFSQNYWPETCAPAFRQRDNAAAWVSSGNQVTVFTGYPSYPLGHLYDGYHVEGLLREEHHDGVRILRNKLTVKSNASVLNRIIHSGTFMFNGYRNIHINKELIGVDYDIVISTTGTIFAAQVGAKFARMINAPLILEVRDITFEQMVATGSNPNSLKVKFIKKWELDLCNQAAMIVALTDGFKEILIDCGISEDKIRVISNGISRTVLNDHHAKDFAKLPIVFGYFGALGVSQNIDLTLEYLSELNRCIDVNYQIVGGGAQGAHLKSLVASAYAFAHIDDPKTPEELGPLFDECDMGIVSLQKSDSFSATLPSKLFHIMGRGIPVLFIGPKGEASGLVSDYDAGIVLTGTYEDDIVKLKSFFTQPDWPNRLESMGQNGRALVESRFIRENLASEFLDLMQGMVNDRKHIA